VRFYRIITLDDRGGIEHLKSRNGEREEFQTRLLHPHKFRKTLVRVFRLKGLRWSLLRKLTQILDENAEYVVRIEARKYRRPNAPGLRKSKHFARANQGKSRWLWQGRALQEPQQTPPESQASPRIKVTHPPGRKPLVLTHQLARLSEEERGS
jgi:hypothetical protein